MLERMVEISICCTLIGEVESTHLVGFGVIAVEYISRLAYRRGVVIVCLTLALVTFDSNGRVIFKSKKV